MSLTRRTSIASCNGQDISPTNRDLDKERVKVRRSLSCTTDNSVIPKKGKDDSETESSYSITLKANFRWRIGNLYKSKNKLYEVGEKMESPLFNSGEFTWRLELYPKGDENVIVDGGHYVSVYLRLVSSCADITKVSYSCSIEFDDIGRTITRSATDDLVTSDRFGFQQFIRMVYLLGNTVRNKTFTISFTIDASLIKYLSAKVKLVQDLKTLYNSERYSDVTIEIENKKFKVHKCLLAIRSTVFDAMFKFDNMNNEKNNIVHISDISYTVMKEILRFVYTGEVENLDDIAKDLLIAAEKYAFADLKLVCENALCKTLNNDSVVKILDFAELHKATKLKEQALKYFVSHVEDVIDTPMFKSMGDSQSPLLAQLIRWLLNKRNEIVLD